MTETCNVAPPVVCIHFAAGYGCYNNGPGVNYDNGQAYIAGADPRGEGRRLAPSNKSLK